MHNLVECHEKRPNNWGNHCGASRAAVAAYLGGHRRQRKQTERLATLQQRLAYLSEYETNWLLCCIRDGRQTLVAWQGNSVATSLAVKGIVVPGSGHLTRIPFTIPDELWQYILSNKERFLKDRDPEAVRRIVEEFKDGFHIA